MQKLNDNIYVLVILPMLGIFILVVSFVVLLFRNQNKLAEQRERLQAAQLEHQKQLLRSVIESQESERTHIGRDLHDDVGTALSNLRITIDRFGREADKNTSVHELASFSKMLIDTIITDLRNISHRLSPEILTMNTLTEAIEELCSIINAAAGVSVFLNNEAGEILDTLDLTSSLAIYRVLEELLTNTIKHSAADSIHVYIRKEADELVIDYRDDGKGMPDAPELIKGRGLHNIESRLGIIQAFYTLAPFAGSGFHMQIKIPIIHN
jgi:signal transduction histidine kinase